MKLDDLRTRLFELPDVEHGFIQHTEAVDRYSPGPVPGGGNTRRWAYRDRTEFRVVLYGKDKRGEAVAATAKIACLQALNQLGVDVPDWLRSDA